ncbi:hypothetical protein BU16DRAFT_294435 [Lophium mytilinum]|uniref:Uncharacterized protein n=1 Tax=Lophium mytilinum TaxID=390894 RepID=A0A6A6R3T2_9PEZI|nr:hypothetical protein BU16DRAFT_294435 [Lophium mytilinum]
MCLRACFLSHIPLLIEHSSHGLTTAFAAPEFPGYRQNTRLCPRCCGLLEGGERAHGLCRCRASLRVCLFHGWRRWSRKVFMILFLAFVLLEVSSIMCETELNEETVMENNVCLQPMSQLTNNGDAPSLIG